jgi:hypothetical protein
LFPFPAFVFALSPLAKLLVCPHGIPNPFPVTSVASTTTSPVAYRTGLADNNRACGAFGFTLHAEHLHPHLHDCRTGATGLVYPGT